MMIYAGRQFDFCPSTPLMLSEVQELTHTIMLILFVETLLLLVATILASEWIM